MGRKRRLSSGFGIAAAGNAYAADQLVLGANDDEAEKQQARDERRRSLAGTPIRRRAEQKQSVEVIQSVYDRCIQLSAANKITQKNTWELELIDCLDDVVDDGGETNFTKASCSIGASVQIYSSRVDSVHQDMFKVLGGLDRADGVDGGDTIDGGVQRKRKKAMSDRSTLEKNSDALNAKKEDFVVEVDAMFQKTSAAFDEGGAAGLLLNQLSVGSGCAIVFDSSTSLAAMAAATSSDSSDSGVGQVDVRPLSLRWASVKSSALPSLQQLRLSCQQLNSHAGAANSSQLNVSFHDPDTGWTPASDDDDDDVDGFCEVGDADEMFGVEDNDSLRLLKEREDAIANMHTLDTNLDNAMPPSPASRRASFRIQMALADAGDDYAYLDADVVRNWATAPGKHWKFRAAAKPQAAPADGRKKGSRKAVVPIDFGGEPVDRDAVFAAPPRCDNRMSDKAKDKRGECDHCLPEDFHVKVSALRQLFLRPNILLRPDSRLQPNSRRTDADTHYYNYDNANDATNYLVEFDDDGDDDVLDTGGDDQFGEVGDLGEASEFQLVAQPEMAARIEIQFAKTAKKLDVKSLKRDIWSKLSVDTLAAPALDPEQVGATPSTVENSQAEATPDDAVVDSARAESWPTFQGTIGSIQQGLDETAKSNSSVPFYFVCLLHLANENDLLLKPGADLGDFSIGRSASSAF